MDDGKTEWSVPRMVGAHPRLLGAYWNAHVSLWILNYKVEELANEGSGAFLLLLPSLLLIDLCRIPFVPLNILRWIRRRRLGRLSRGPGQDPTG